MQKRRTIIFAVLIICVVLLIMEISNKIINKKPRNQIALEDNTIDTIVYDANMPVISAGMIPVKKERK